MKNDLALKILSGILNHWDQEDLLTELKDIQIIADIKYDSYQQYTHGKRYIESLAMWLRQFDEGDRGKVYRFVKENLIFISENEMLQLVELAYSTKIKQYLMKETKKICETENIVDLKKREEVFNLLRRKTLFLGLSDGAHLDYFRRYNSMLSNEQVFVHYEFSKEKADDMKKELENDLKGMKLFEQYKDNVNIFGNNNFNRYILIDDFSASGTSFIRDKGNSWGGKIKKFYDRLENYGYNVEGVEINLILYAATEKAIKYITENVDKCFEKKITFNVDAIQIIHPIDLNPQSEIESILENNYNKLANIYSENYNDKHFKVGGGAKPYLGYADCALPLVLYHNTPNNSFPVLWYTWSDEINALFPRVTRHKE